MSTQKMNFRVPNGIAEALASEALETGRSMSKIAVDALREYLVANSSQVVPRSEVLLERDVSELEHSVLLIQIALELIRETLDCGAASKPLAEVSEALRRRGKDHWDRRAEDTAKALLEGRENHANLTLYQGRIHGQTKETRNV